MGLGTVLGLGMVLYVVGFSIVDEYRLRTFDAPDREPVTRPPVSTPETREAEQLAADRIRLMKERKLTLLLLTDYRFTDRITRKDMADPESIRKKLDEMLQEMLRHLELPPVFTVAVIPDRDGAIAPDRGAECNFPQHRINFFLRGSETPETLTAMLCHECAHYFSYHHGMYEYKRFLLNEWNTDTVACLMGFSKYMLASDHGHYLKTEQLRAVRWTLLQERKALSAAQAGQAS